VPPGAKANLREATEFIDSLECKTLISAGRRGADINREALLKESATDGQAFGEKADVRFGRSGERGKKIH